MNKTIQDIDKFHQTKQGKLIFGTVEIFLAYLIVSRAIDTGSLWQYLFFLILLVGGVNNLIRVFVSSNHGKRGSNKK